MNVLTRTVVNITRSFITNYTPVNKLHVIGNYGFQGSLVSKMKESLTNTFQALEQIRYKTTLKQMHERGRPYKRAKKSKNPLNGKPFAKGVILKTVIKKPKKPNSANRKCVIVKLSTGKEMTAYVPGIGHNLQEHNVVLCRVGRLQDTPGVKIKCVRGKYDLPHVKRN
ncbi:PREDICTED: 40S ribosomal protein S12, mitochondrial [Polistes dominula]|uniref:Small ribosomal subunit protein uS12m n=1 Tax=Polistes dominula TaxID=743375 RepID=A0ABM1I1L1_POLDO|nr:PREDICTED: 40S ribosomal protein S12, mitochondrial [Polistes dominula]